MRKTTNIKLVPVLTDQQIGLEARAAPDDHLSVKVWLRLLACSAQIEQEIRQRLRVRFGTTLARSACPSSPIRLERLASSSRSILEFDANPA